MPSEIIIRLETFLLRILLKFLKRSKKSRRTKKFLYTLVYSLSFNSRITYTNLKRAFPEKTKKQLRNLNKSFIHKNLDYFADFLNSPEITKENFDNSFKIKNFKYYEEAIRQGNGVIVTSGHFGNFFLACSLGPMIVNNKIIALLDVESAPGFRNEIIEILASRGAKIVPRKEWRKCFDYLKQNQVFSLVADQANGNQSVVDVKFFRNTTKFPIGPPLISYKCKAPIIPFFIFAEDDGYEIIFEKPIIPEPKQDLQVYIQITMQKLATLLESYIKKYPHHYCWRLRF